MLSCPNSKYLNHVENDFCQKKLMPRRAGDVMYEQILMDCNDDITRTGWEGIKVLTCELDGSELVN